jgi:hypothetical protein
MEQEKVCVNGLSYSYHRLQEFKNIFDNLPAFKKPTKSTALLNKLQLYLSTPPEASSHTFTLSLAVQKATDIPPTSSYGPQLFINPWYV